MADTANSAASASTNNTPPAADAASAAGAADKAKAPEQTKLEKLKLKVYGKEDEYDVETVKAWAQKGIAADKKFAELSKKEKEIAEVNSALEAGDEKSLDVLKRKMGADKFHKLAVKYFQDIIAEEKMSPEERKLTERERALRKREEEIKAESEKTKSEKLQALQGYFEERFDQEIPEAVKSAGLPGTPYVVKRMAEYMLQSLDMKLDLPWSSIAKLVKEEVRGNTKAVLSSLTEDQLVEELGEEVSERFRKAQLKKLKEVPSAKSGSGQRRSQAEAEPSEVSDDVDAWRKHIEEFKNRSKR